MREVTKTVLIFLAGFVLVLLASALLAPWLHTFLPFKFGRILRRCIMIGTLALGFWLLRRRRASLGQLGLSWREESLRLLRNGFLYGVAIVTAITIVQWTMGARIWRLHDTDVWHWIGFFFKGLGAGILIGTIEEFFFRGFLFQMFKELWNVPAGLVASNLIYAVVHFFPKSSPLIGPEPTVADSFQILTAMFPSLFERPEVAVGITGLFIFGLILAFVFLRTGSLYPAIGIHAGCVFALKLNRRFFPDVAEKMSLMTGTKLLYDGVAGVLVLAAMSLILAGILKISLRGKGLRSGMALFLLAALLLGNSSCTKKSGEGLPDLEGPVYSFLENLPEARAMRVRKGEAHMGIWAEARHRLEGLPRAADVLVTRKTLVRGKTLPAIRFRALPGHASSLVFEKVPPARTLHVFSALADSTFKKAKEVAPVEFEVWIGKKKIYSNRISLKGWHEQKVDLTLPYLLNRKYRYTFKVRTSSKKSRNFVFYALLK